MKKLAIMVMKIAAQKKLEVSFSQKNLSVFCYFARKGKKRNYKQRIREDDSSFAPFVISCTGGMSNLSTTLYKSLTSMIKEKKKKLRIVKCFGGFDVALGMRFSDL